MKAREQKDENKSWQIKTTWGEGGWGGGARGDDIGVERKTDDWRGGEEKQMKSGGRDR